MNDRISQTRSAAKELPYEETRKGLTYLAEMKLNAVEIKDALIKAYKEKEDVGDKPDLAS